MSITLQECLSVGAEVIRELLQGKSAQGILDNIDLNDIYLTQMVAAMETVAYNPDSLVVVLNDDETFTGLRGCSIRQGLDEMDEDGNEFGDVVMEM